MDLFFDEYVLEFGIGVDIEAILQGTIKLVSLILTAAYLELILFVDCDFSMNLVIVLGKYSFLHIPLKSLASCFLKGTLIILFEILLEALAWSTDYQMPNNTGIVRFDFIAVEVLKDSQQTF